MHLQAQASSTIWRETSIQEAGKGESWRHKDAKRKSSRQVKGHRVKYDEIRLPPVTMEMDLILRTLERVRERVKKMQLQ